MRLKQCEPQLCIFALLASMALVIVSPANASNVTIYNLVSGGSALEGFAIVGLPGVNPIHLSSGPLVVNGNVAVGADGTFQADGGGQIDGTVYAASNATTSSSDTITGGIVVNNTIVSNAVAGAEALESFVAMQTATQTFTSSITNPTAITGDGGLNVIDVNGNIQLSGGTLTLSGGPNDLFVFDVTGNMAFSGGTQIVLNGINPNQVLFDILGTGWALQTSSSSNAVEGIFLAPNGGIQINGGTDNAEFIGLTAITGQSNPNVSAPQAPPVPEPSSLGLALAGMVAGSLALLLRRRRSYREFTVK